MQNSELFKFFQYSAGVTGSEWQSREGYIVREIRDDEGNVRFVVKSPRGYIYTRSFATLPTALRAVLKKQGDL